MITKLKQKSGETLMETLFSMMIAVLCMGMLCSAIAAATNINEKTRELDKKYSDELNAVEGMTDDTTSEKNLVITFQPQDGTPAYTEEVIITVYGDEDSAFLSYDYEGETP